MSKRFWVDGDWSDLGRYLHDGLRDLGDVGVEISRDMMCNNIMVLIRQRTPDGGGTSYKTSIPEPLILKSRYGYTDTLRHEVGRIVIEARRALAPRPVLELSNGRRVPVDPIAMDLSAKERGSWV